MQSMKDSNQTMGAPPHHTPQSTSSSITQTQPSSPSSSRPHTATTARGNIMVDGAQRPMRNYDGTEMRDAQSNVVFKSQYLSTHPLKTDCKQRVGYGGKKFTYVSGDGVIRTMNAIFGHCGWSSQITMERNVLSEKDEKGRWCVGYLASVRVTILDVGASHEDCGSGEGIDPNKVKAHEKALKSAITDAMKRSARHFGERLGNALYVKGSGIHKAPRTNRDALRDLERTDALNLFGDQAALRDNHNNPSSPDNKKPSPTVVIKIRTAGSAATTTTTSRDASLQKENWPQNRAIAGPTAKTTTTTAHSFHNRLSPNNGVVAAAVTQHSALSMGCSTVMPSPIAPSIAPSRIINGNAGVRTGNPSLVSNNNNETIVYPQPPTNENLMMNAPRPPNLMAPPPRPVYNPGGGGGALHGKGGNRGLDGIAGSHKDNGGHNNNGPTSYMMNNNNGSGTKRKMNPYNNNGSKKRFSV